MTRRSKGIWSIVSQQAVVDYLRSKGAKDLCETTPPDYATAHKCITEHFVEQQGPLSRWKLEIPGEPLVTIHLIATSKEYPEEQLLFTVGLSDRRLPAEWGEFACGELKMSLPADWSISEVSQADVRWNWPIEGLKRIAIELRKGDRWPKASVLFPNGNPPIHNSAAGFVCRRSAGVFKCPIAGGSTSMVCFPSTRKRCIWFVIAVMSR